MITQSSSHSHSILRQAQSLAKACYYHDIAAREPERVPHGCGYIDGQSCEYCDTWPGAAWRAESDMLLARRDKALSRIDRGHQEDIINVIADYADVYAAVVRTLRLLGHHGEFAVHGFGPASSSFVPVDV